MIVIGLGNEFRHDDAAGLIAARRLRESGVPAEEHDGDPMMLMDRWKGSDAVLLMDAVSSGAVAGTIHRLDVSTAPVPLVNSFHSSTHALGVAEAIELSRTLGSLPSHVHILGIEGKDFSAGIGLSGEVDRAIHNVVQEIVFLYSREAAAFP